MSSIPSNRFAGRTVVLTGGGSGIGRVTAQAFADEGARVAVVGRRVEPLIETIDGREESMIAIAGDVSRSGDAARIVADVVAAFGGIDVLVNNAAVWLPRTIDALTDDDIVASLMTNQFGVITMIRECLPHLRNGGGAIVNLSSTGARVPLAANCLYAGTKAGVEQMTRTLAVELGPSGVRVNTVAPGATDTEMIGVYMDEQAVAQTIAATPLGRMGVAEDIARSILFLASDDAGWVTGQILQSTGGLML